MACNTPTHGYPDWSFTDPTATSIWRTTRYRIFSQRCWMHPEFCALFDEDEARYRFMKTYNELIGKRMTGPGLN